MKDAHAQVIGSSKAPLVGFLVLMLIVCASWAWFALDHMPLTIVMPAAALAFAGQIVLLSRIRGPADKPLIPALETIARISHRPEPGGRHLVRDEITGLYHRWYMEMRLEEEAARCERYGYSMAVLVVRFGSVELSDIGQDSWPGRAIAAAETCVRVLRSVDLSGYLAPNEFAICLVHCDLPGAERALERLQAEVSEFSCTAGISVYPSDNCEPLALIDLARIRSRQRQMQAAA